MSCYSSFTSPDWCSILCIHIQYWKEITLLGRGDSYASHYDVKIIYFSGAFVNVPLPLVFICFMPLSVDRWCFDKRYFFKKHHGEQIFEILAAPYNIMKESRWVINELPRSVILNASEKALSSYHIHISIQVSIWRKEHFACQLSASCKLQQWRCIKDSRQLSIWY